jgi:hypothetical protein
MNSWLKNWAESGPICPNVRQNQARFGPILAKLDEFCANSTQLGQILAILARFWAELGRILGQISGLVLILLVQFWAKPDPIWSGLACLALFGH